MEGNNSTNSMSKFVLPLVAVVIIIVAVVAVYATTNNSSNTQSQTPTTTQPDTTTRIEESQLPEYKDGTYSADGNYVSPGGPREIGLTITLAGGVITDTTFEGRADDPTSQRFQGEFGDNYAPMIVGKNIDEVSLTKVSGSSLTPKGFTDALEKIKTEARS